MWKRNITNLDAQGTFRSLNGAADESIFQGRASKAGYFCFFKVWRDMPYDAVLDHEGNMYRVEVKGTSGDKFEVTRGSRSGKQIIKEKSASRTRRIERADCDFVVGVDSNNGECYIIPTDIIEIIGVNNLSKKAVESYKEKWDLFKFDDGKAIPPVRMSKENTRDGLMNLSLAEVQTIASSLKVSIPTGDIEISGHRTKVTDTKNKIIFSIWEHLSKL